MNTIIIEIEKSENCGICVAVNGVTVYECLADDELEEITLGEVLKGYYSAEE